MEPKPSEVVFGNLLRRAAQAGNEPFFTSLLAALVISGAIPSNEWDLTPASKMEKNAGLRAGCSGETK